MKTNIRKVKGFLALVGATIVSAVAAFVSVVCVFEVLRHI